MGIIDRRAFFLVYYTDPRLDVILAVTYLFGIKFFWYAKVISNHLGVKQHSYRNVCEKIEEEYKF